MKTRSSRSWLVALFIDRVAGQCVNVLTPKWSGRLGGFDVYIWDQCYSMEQSLRIE